MLRRDKELLIQATECLRDTVTLELLEQWWNMPHNLMLVEGDNVGIASFEYPGVYTLHWYYQSARGREAINLGKRMVRFLFEHCGAKTLRGLVKREMKASNWACRQVGMRAYGPIVYPGGEVNELFCLTKEEFLNKEQSE